MNNFDDFFSSKQFKDDFGWSDEWNAEMEKWLQLLKEINPDHYEIYKNRAQKQRGDEHRDALLAEIQSLYYISGILKLPIVEIEPIGKGTTKLEFIFEDASSEQWKTEVKAPSWRSQIMKDSNLTLDQKKARLLQPKIRTGDGGSFSPIEEIHLTLEDPVKNALPKFIKGENNLLIVVPDMLQETKIMIAIASMGGINNPIVQELSMLDSDEVISAAMIIEPWMPAEENKVIRWNKLIPITKEPKLPQIF